MSPFLLNVTSNPIKIPQKIKFLQPYLKAFINVIMIQVETRIWNQQHSDSKGSYAPKRCLVLDHLEFMVSKLS